MIRILAIALIIVSLLGQSRADGGMNEIHPLVFSTEGIPLKPSETLDELKLLKSKLDNPNVLDGLSAQEIERLIQLSVVDPSKCVYDHFVLLRHLTTQKYNSPDRINLIPYVKQCRNEQLKKCKLVWNQFVRGLKKAESDGIAAIKNDVVKAKQASNGLSAHSFKADPFTETYTEKNLVDGLVTFIKSRPKTFEIEKIREKDQGKAYLQEKFNATVGKLCRLVVDKLAGLKIYSLFVDTEEREMQLDRFGIEWFTTFKICHRVLASSDALLNKIYHFEHLA